jgi:glycosyltransferase involved in cell wall biosynthesis
VPFQDISSYISDADVGIVVVPNGANIALPNKLFEYMAMGKPAVVTKIPSITSYYDDDVVMYYEPGNEHSMARCILELYNNPQKRKELGLTGLTIYQNVRWTVMQEKYISIYKNRNKITSDVS